MLFAQEWSVMGVISYVGVMLVPCKMCAHGSGLFELWLNSSAPGSVRGLTVLMMTLLTTHTFAPHRNSPPTLSSPWTVPITPRCDTIHSLSPAVLVTHHHNHHKHQPHRCHC